VWEHYMVLLFVPIALVSPRFSKLWLVPACTLWVLVISTVVSPVGSTGDGLTVREAVLWLVLEAIVARQLCRAAPAEGRSAPRRLSLSVHRRLRSPPCQVASLPGGAASRAGGRTV
jgi:hypothetical protein